MDYIKKIFLLGGLFLLGGCASFRGLKTYEDGYRQGVKENIQDFTKNYYGNDFPYFNWAGPIVQSVRIPAHIENGMFIPEHNAPVLIQPGEWRSQYTYPISTQGGENVNEKKSEKYAVEYSNIDLYDITVLPKAYPGADARK